MRNTGTDATECGTRVLGTGGTGGKEGRRPPANDVASCHGKSIRHHRPPLRYDDHPPQCNDLQTGKILQREVSGFAVEIERDGERVEEEGTGGGKGQGSGGVKKEAGPLRRK